MYIEWSMLFVPVLVNVPILLGRTIPLSLTGSKAVFEKVSIYAADARTGATTASELAEQVTWTIYLYPAYSKSTVVKCRCSDMRECCGYVDT